MHVSGKATSPEPREILATGSVWVKEQRLEPGGQSKHFGQRAGVVSTSGHLFSSISVSRSSLQLEMQCNRQSFVLSSVRWPLDRSVLPLHGRCRYHLRCFKSSFHANSICQYANKKKIWNGVSIADEGNLPSLIDLAPYRGTSALLGWDEPRNKRGIGNLLESVLGKGPQNGTDGFLIKCGDTPVVVLRKERRRRRHAVHLLNGASSAYILSQAAAILMPTFLQYSLLVQNGRNLLVPKAVSMPSLTSVCLSADTYSSQTPIAWGLCLVNENWFIVEPWNFNHL